MNNTTVILQIYVNFYIVVMIIRFASQNSYLNRQARVDEALGTSEDSVRMNLCGMQIIHASYDVHHERADKGFVNVKLDVIYNILQTHRRLAVITNSPLANNYARVTSQNAI